MSIMKLKGVHAIYSAVIGANHPSEEHRGKQVEVKGPECFIINTPDEWAICDYDDKGNICVCKSRPGFLRFDALGRDGGLPTNNYEYGPKKSSDKF